MNNIFENAYFGKPYRTKNGRKAVFYNHHNSHAREKARYVTMILEGQESIYKWYYDGTAADCQEHLDIVSEWEEPIDGEKLDKLADNYAKNLFPNEDNVYTEALRKECGRDFKAGYRKCWEDKK